MWYATVILEMTRHPINELYYNIWKYPPSIVAMIIVLPHIDWIAT